MAVLLKGLTYSYNLHCWETQGGVGQEGAWSGGAWQEGAWSGGAGQEELGIRGDLKEKTSHTHTACCTTIVLLQW